MRASPTLTPRQRSCAMPASSLASLQPQTKTSETVGGIGILSSEHVMSYIRKKKIRPHNAEGSDEIHADYQVVNGLTSLNSHPGGGLSHLRPGAGGGGIKMTTLGA